MPAERQLGEHLFAFVIGVRADHHDASEGVEPLQRLADFDFAGEVPLAADGDESQTSSAQTAREAPNGRTSSRGYYGFATNKLGGHGYR